MKLLFTEITQQERERILEMHKKENKLISEQQDYSYLNKFDKSKQLTQKQIEAEKVGWGPVTDEYAGKLPVGSDGKILPNPNTSSPSNTTNTSSKNTPSGAVSKGNQSQTVFDLVQSTKNETTGKNYNWKEVRDAWQKANPKGILGSQEQNIALGKAWKTGWRPPVAGTTTGTDVAQPAVVNSTDQQYADIKKGQELNKKYGQSQDNNQKTLSQAQSIINQPQMTGKELYDKLNSDGRIQTRDFGGYLINNKDGFLNDEQIKTLKQYFATFNSQLKKERKNGMLVFTKPKTTKP